MRNHLEMNQLPRQLLYDVSQKYGVNSIEAMKLYNAFWQVFAEKLVSNKENLATKEPEKLYIPYIGALELRRRTLRYFRHEHLKKLQRSIAAIQSNSDDGEQV